MSRPDLPFLPAVAVGPSGDGTLTGQAVRPVCLVLSAASYRHLFAAQKCCERTKPVWDSNPPQGGDVYFARLFGQPIQAVGHAQAQGAAWRQDMLLPSIFGPGHDAPLHCDWSRVAAAWWGLAQKPWEDSHGR